MINKLDVLGSVLYVAAHPDDENTRVISYLANHEQFYTAYLSATRGDGGQNLIGSEIREALGVIRTQELLAARRVDGGAQYFTRANDFGYSKNPEETFNIWDREEVLADFVLAIRRHKPDVIITRFPEDGGGGHGHHTASAILGREAMDYAADKSAFVASAERHGVWQAKRLYFNTHPWFYSRRNLKMDTAKFYTKDIGAYAPLLGRSYTEIAGFSRSQHRSQGFGTIGTRGEMVEYFEFIQGDRPIGKPAETDIFQGIDISWSRLPDAKRASKLVTKIKSTFNPQEPHEILDLLIDLKREIKGLENEFWKQRKLEELDELIVACTGLYAELVAESYQYTAGDTLKFKLELVNRSNKVFSFENLEVSGLYKDSSQVELASNKKVEQKGEFVIPDDYSDSNPYWLRKQGTTGMYTVDDMNLRGTPENTPSFEAKIKFNINGYELELVRPIVFKKKDPVLGEQYRPIHIVPAVMVNIIDPVYVFGDRQPKKIDVTVLTAKDNVSGVLALTTPYGWKIEPESVLYDLAVKGSEKTYTFSITPPEEQSVVNLGAYATYDGKKYDQSVVPIAYDHIPNQLILPQASTKLVKVDLQKKGQLVAYVKGAGDVVPESLQQVGYDVDELTVDQLTVEGLTKYDALILGVRAFNTIDEIAFKTDVMKSYVEQGGTVVVQYNTAHALKTKDFAPYHLKLSRDRVTDENAKVTLLNPSHQVLNYPNKINESDFEDWVQERGLYFPNEWGEEFESIISCHDPNEEPLDGGLLVAQYGKGYYIYTGYSWFRQLPAGVPGAYRLFTNMISIGK